MIKILYIVIALLVVACSGANVSFETPPVTTEYRALKSTEILQTKTPIPTATVDSYATSQVALTQVAVALNQAAIAQATADAANRLVVEATNAHEQREHEIALSNAQGTQQAQSEKMVVYGWTVTAAFTSIPLTQTQQSIINTQIPRQQALMAGALTATKEAPTQMVAMTNAENYSKYWIFEFILRMFAFVGLGVFLIGIGIFAFYRRGTQKEENAIDELPDELPFIVPDETRIVMANNYGASFGTTYRTIVPCSPEQLTELATKVLSGEKNKTLAINEWEYKDTGLTRKILVRLRNWLQLNRFAESIGAGRIMLVDAGIAFLEEWVAQKELLNEYEFEEVKNEAENDKIE